MQFFLGKKPEVSAKMTHPPQTYVPEIFCMPPLQRGAFFTPAPPSKLAWWFFKIGSYKEDKVSCWIFHTLTLTHPHTHTYTHTQTHTHSHTRTKSNFCMSPGLSSPKGCNHPHNIRSYSRYSGSCNINENNRFESFKTPPQSGCITLMTSNHFKLIFCTSVDGPFILRFRRI